MKLKTSFRLLLFLAFTFLFFIHSNSVSALEDFDPTQDYSVHSLPVLSTDSQVLVQPKDESIDTQQSTFVPFQTAKDIEATPSNLNIAITQLKDFVTEHGREIEMTIVVFSGTSMVSYLLFKRVMQSIVNSQIRVVGLLSAVVLSATSGVAVIAAYNQQMSFFESTTGWQFSPFGEDLLIVGGIVSASLIFFVGPTLLVGVKSLATVLPAAVPNWKKILSYVTKETKSAFTETEKECADSIGKCSSLFDKTVILLFNYLPGNMPDLGMDDAIINFKNTLFKTPQPQKAK